jgi:ribosomal protein S18 acetylase RimI-like enzyme
MDARIQQSVVANLSGRPRPIETGPFVIGFDPGTDSPGINYATPRPGAPITSADVTGLVRAFREIGRKPRLEYVTSCAPGLEALLAVAGFTVEARHDYLVCTTGSLQPPPVPAGYELRRPVTDADCAALISAQNEAFGGEPVAGAADVARMRRLQSNGGVAVTAVTTGAVTTGAATSGAVTSGAVTPGACAGGGQAVPPNDGVSEVAGIAVREPHRRRGLAAAVTARIAEDMFAAGADVAWLEAGGEDSWRVYERVGFRPTGKRLYVALD